MPPLGVGVDILTSIHPVREIFWCRMETGQTVSINTIYNDTGVALRRADGGISINYIPSNPDELLLCLGDELWRMNNLYEIVDERHELVRFRLRYVQLKFLIDRIGLDII